jgi:hypothetical protein
MAASTVLIALALALSSGAGETPRAAAQGFELIESRVAPATADGRYTLTEANARSAAVLNTPDGRFQLIETRQPAVGCEPFPEALFANGFE